MASLEQKIRTAAAAFPALVALLGSGSPVLFRWYDTTLVQGSEYPAVVVMIASDPSQYNIGARMPMSWSRIQFTVWGGQYAGGSVSCDQVTAVLLNFLDQADFTANTKTTVQQNNLVVGNRRGAFVLKDTTIYQRILDVQILSDSNA